MTPIIASTPEAMRFIRRALELRPICDTPKCMEPSVSVVANPAGKVVVECPACRQRRELLALPPPPSVAAPSAAPEAVAWRERAARYRLAQGKVPRAAPAVAVAP